MRASAVLIVAALLSWVIAAEPRAARASPSYTVLEVPGTFSLADALDRAEQLLAEPEPVPVAIELSTGRYYLTETIELGPAFSGPEDAPSIVRPVKGAVVVISGGQRLNVSWEQYGAGPLFRASVGTSLAFDQVFMNDEPQVRAATRTTTVPDPPRRRFRLEALRAMRSVRPEFARRAGPTPLGASSMHCMAPAGAACTTE